MKKLPSHLEITLNYFNIPNKQFDIDKVINVYTYGSHVYETATDKSDIDYIIVYEQDNDMSDTLVTDIANNVLNATLMSPSYFQKRLDEHEIDVIECFFLREDYQFITFFYYIFAFRNNYLITSYYCTYYSIFRKLNLLKSFINKGRSSTY